MTGTARQSIQKIPSADRESLSDSVLDSEIGTADSRMPF